jgi:hypothetical protein
MDQISTLKTRLKIIIIIIIVTAGSVVKETINKYNSCS